MAQSKDQDTPQGQKLTRRQVMGVIGKWTAGIASLGTGITAGLYLDSRVTGTTISRKEAGDPAPPDSSPTLEQLTQHPGSRSSMMILSALSFSRSNEVMDALSDGNTPLYFTHRTDTDRTRDYNKTSASFADKGELLHIDMLDPAVSLSTAHSAHDMQTGHKLEFEMIAHHSRPDALDDFEAAAYYNKESKSLILAFSGIDEHKLAPLMATMRDHGLNPQINHVDAFMQDLQHQLELRQLDVKKSAIFGHSIGADPAVKALSYCLEHEELRRHLGKDVPKTVLYEDWMGMQTARACVAESHNTITLDDLSTHVISIRHWPATFTGERENPPMGQKMAIMPVDYEHLDPSFVTQVDRQNEHRVKPTIIKLGENKENIHEHFTAEFVAPHLFTSVADPAWRFKETHPVATDIIVPTGVIGIGLAAKAGKNFIDRRNKGLQEKRDKRSSQQPTRGV